MSEILSKLEAIATKQDFRLRTGSLYLLVGGLGGLGRAISNWMVERGAKHFIFPSRSAGKSHNDQAFPRELNAQGCSVKSFAGNVVKPDDAESVVRNTAVPVAGVMHNVHGSNSEIESRCFRQNPLPERG